MNWQDPQFQALKAQWYETLREVGFHDVEEDHLNEVKLKQYNLHKTSRYLRKHHFRHEEFYTMCMAFSATPEYEAVIRKFPYYNAIWELFCEGYSFRRIGIQVKRDMYSVRFIVRRLKRIMNGQECFLDQSSFYRACLQFTTHEAYLACVAGKPKRHKTWILYTQGLPASAIARRVRQSIHAVKWNIRKIRKLMKDAEFNSN